MTSRRRGTYWAHVSEGAAILEMAAGAVSRLLLMSLRETEVGREYEGFTVTRVISNLYLFGQTSTDLVITSGLILHAENVAIGQIDPVAEPHTDWLLNEEHVVSQGVEGNPMTVHRDLGSQRKARGGESELFWYLFNRSGAAIRVHRSARVLLKRA